MIKENPKVPLFKDYPNICTKCLVECGNTCIHCGDKKESSKIISQPEIKCADCGKDLTEIFCHYVIKKRTLCGFCRCQYNSKGVRN